jgi:predicted neuraminidase
VLYLKKKKKNSKGYKSCIYQNQPNKLSKKFSETHANSQGFSRAPYRYYIYFLYVKNVDHIWLILTHQRSDKDHKNITPIMMYPF